MEQSNNGKEMCRKCHGRGYHIRGSIYLKTICEYCKGRKDVDWIDYVSGNPSPRPYDMNVKRELVAQNVQSLITEIKSILMQEGIYVCVTVEQYANTTEHYLQQHVNPTMIGSKNFLIPELEPKKILFSS